MYSSECVSNVAYFQNTRVVAGGLPSPLEQGKPPIRRRIAAFVLRKLKGAEALVVAWLRKQDGGELHPNHTERVLHGTASAVEKLFPDDVKKRELLSWLAASDAFISAEIRVDILKRIGIVAGMPDSKAVLEEVFLNVDRAQDAGKYTLHKYDELLLALNLLRSFVREPPVGLLTLHA